ncbi:Isopenicillin N epimerase component 1 [Cytospora mali]|uniref:Isopenicillin N epimerase component 1 n=1 Tax=Cytospora mali TaxID=578113 RepID=A0A194VBD3_CYTMA|nr:Isopenicillin N epimerase component 1 [Valsa mali var. pyri (nom. inval.)]
MSSIGALLVQAAAAVAGLAYLDARLNLRQDIDFLLSRRVAFAGLMAAGTSDGRISIYYQFENSVKRKGSDEALWSHAESLTYHQTYVRVHQYAQWFLSQGVKPGDLAAIFMINSTDMVCAWMGLMAIGAAPALINTNLVSRALIHCVEVAKANLVLADGDEEMMGRLDGVKAELEASGHRIFRLGDVREEILALEPIRPGNELRKMVNMDSPMALAYTSGTTGLPKAIVFPMLVAFLASMAKRRGFGLVKGEDQRCYNCMPYYHLTGGLQAVVQLVTGDALLIAPRFSARTFWHDIHASRATFFIYVGEALRYLLAQPPSPLDKTHSVHTVLGNGLRADVWIPFRERFGIDTIHEFYNSTELMFGLSNPCRGDFTAHSLGIHGAIQRLLFRGQFAAVATDTETGELIRDPPGTGFAQRVPLDVGGEIIVRLDPNSTMFGRSFRGYWQNDAATEKKIARDVFKKGDMYFRTGDALRRDGDGRWFFCDRLGDTFRWKGENVSTTEVSELLGTYPGVVEAVVYGVQVPGHEGRAGAVALLIDKDVRPRFDFESFLRHCRAGLPKYAVPIFIRLVDEPLTTGNHKQNKVPLKTEGVDPDKVSNGDEVLWIKDGKADVYVPFTREDWKGLTTGRAKL